MALPINIEDLLNKRKIEGNRIEFKKGQGEADEVLCSQRIEQYHCQGRGSGRIEGHG